jgi:hypothetical protein
MLNNFIQCFVRTHQAMLSCDGHPCFKSIYTPTRVFIGSSFPHQDLKPEVILRLACPLYDTVCAVWVACVIPGSDVF